MSSPPPPPSQPPSRNSQKGKTPMRPHIRLNSNPQDLLAGDNPWSDDQDTSSDVQSSSAEYWSSFSSRHQLSSPFSDPTEAPSPELLVPPRPRSRFSRRQIHRAARHGVSPYKISRKASSESRSSEDDRYGPVASSFLDVYHFTRAGALHGYVNTQTVAEKFSIMPSAGLLVFPEDVEKDDWLHNPTVGDRDSRGCSPVATRCVINVTGLVFISIGVLFLFIGWPVMSYIRRLEHSPGPSCATDPNCISADMPLLQNVRTGLIDPATPLSARIRKAADGTYQQLVFSDEFNRDGRTFYENDDAYFQAVDLWYGVTQDLEWYDPDAITTENGTLSIRFEAFRNNGLNYRSGMLQSWNQMCFKGGHMEASISLPGNGNTSGFWPGFWAMGNLGRPGYASTTEGMWPYSYWDTCDYGITPNQSQADGISYLPGMKLPACVCSEDATMHPTPGKSRSVPELDVIEASAGTSGPGGVMIGTASQSAQFAPFDIWYLPNYEFAEIDDDTITSANGWRGGPFQEAFSCVTNLNYDWYNGKAYQKYGLEYTPGATGKVSWFVGDDRTWSLDARAMAPNGNVGQRLIPEEPMALIVNFGMSSGFAFIDFPAIGALLPATMRIDYIRVYQPSGHSPTCDPEGYPTTEYIAAHPKAYKDPQKTLWRDTGYTWPKNSFVHGCRGV